MSATWKRADLPPGEAVTAERFSSADGFAQVDVYRFASGATNIVMRIEGIEFRRDGESVDVVLAHADEMRSDKVQLLHYMYRTEREDAFIDGAIWLIDQLDDSARVDAVALLSRRSPQAIERLRKRGLLPEGGL